MRAWAFALFGLGIAHTLCTARAQVQCGRDAGGALCPNGLCCSAYGYCGSTAAYCCDGCQSNCNCAPPPPIPPPPPVAPPPPYTPPPPGGNIESLISEAMFDEMLLHRNDRDCHAVGFYTYAAFVSVANSFPGFASTGDVETRKREIAAFLGQTSHETTGGWDDAPDGRWAWGYCYLKEGDGDVGSNYCEPSDDWPCEPGKQYYGRGPIQISYNTNYGQAGQALGLPLLTNPDLVAEDPVISFKAALWFWMTPQGLKPSCHDVITGQWTPSASDVAANRLPGYGVITNIINGGVECGIGPDDRVKDRIGFYERYCDMFGVSYGDNLDCYNQRPFTWGRSVQAW